MKISYFNEKYKITEFKYKNLLFKIHKIQPGNNFHKWMGKFRYLYIKPTTDTL